MRGQRLLVCLVTWRDRNGLSDCQLMQFVLRALTTNMTSADRPSDCGEIRTRVAKPKLQAGADRHGKNRWLISPMHMARAYLELNRRRDLRNEEIVTGWRSRQGGTGSAVDRALRGSAALVKTDGSVYAFCSCSRGRLRSGR